MKAPGSLAGLGFIGLQESANAVLTAGHPHNHLVLDCERGHGDRVAVPEFRQLHLPHQGTGLGVDRLQAGIQRAQEEKVVQDGQPSVDEAAAHAHFLGDLVVVGPEDAPGPGIQGDHHVGRPGQVHDPVHHQGSRLEILERLRLINPLQLQVLNVGFPDLIQVAVPLAVVGSGIGQPIAGLVVSVHNSLVADLPQEASGPQGNKREIQQDLHGEAPFPRSV